jgi:DNA-binding CsgD family transcriptional regulator
MVSAGMPVPRSIRIDPASGFILSLKRRWKRGPFEHRDVEAVARLLPAMQRSVEAAEALSMAKRLHRFSKRSPNDIAFLIEREGHVLGALPPEPLAGGHLSISAGRRLCATSPSQRGLVPELIERATHRQAAASALLERESGGPGWSLRIVPTPRPLHHVWELPSFVAVVSEIRGRLNPDHEIAVALSDLFGLSPAEARIAALVSYGWTIESAAVALSLSPATVRSHLKSVFSRTAVNRQTDLAVLVSRI